MAFPAFLDTCVLYPAYLCDTLPRLAEASAYRPLWSTDILVELRRNLLDRGIPGERVGPERLGRYEPVRVWQRQRDSISPACTSIVVVDDSLADSVTVRVPGGHRA